MAALPVKSPSIEVSKQVDQKLGLTDVAARCIAAPRNPLLITHAVRDMVLHRVYKLALGWEDLNDHGQLRQDVAL